MHLRQKNLKKILVVSLSSMGMAFCAYNLHLLNNSETPYTPGAIEAGYLEGKHESVRRKGDASLLWNDLNFKQKIYWDDAISTGVNSIAQLRLDQNIKVVLMPSSLAVLTRENGRISIELQQGNMQIKNSALTLGQNQVIRINGQDVEISNSTAIEVDEVTGGIKLVKADQNAGTRQAVVLNNLGVEMAAGKEESSPFDIPFTATMDDLIANLTDFVSFKWALKAGKAIINSVRLPSSEETLAKPPPQKQTPSHEKAIVMEPKEEKALDALASPSLKKEPEAPAVPDPALRKTPLLSHFWGYLGVGGSSSSYAQKSSGTSDLQMGGFNGPSFDAQTGFMSSPHFGFEFKYLNSPGVANSSSNIKIKNSTYEYRSFGVQVIYRPAEATSDLTAEWLIRAGIMNEVIPFLLPTAANELELQTRNLYLLSAGIERRWMATDHLRVRASLSYDYTMTANPDLGTSFSVQPQFSADAVLGADYEFKQNYYLGVNWSNRYESHKFEYRDDTEGYFSGEQTFIHSNISVRLGVEL